jgi:exodeoxyribonuclease V beta subunit
MTLEGEAPGAEHFDLFGPLPTGRLSIEASAGTGKTFALAALATRFLAERDISTSDLLIVTFTRAATSELRARVRDRLVQAAHHLEHGGDTDDALLVHLASADREARLGRLARAVTEFDAATVTTIHGFATQVRATLGVQSGSDPHATMVDDSAQLAAECCADVLAAAALRHEQLPKFSTLVLRTRTAINIPDLRLAPGADQDGLADPADLLMVELVERSIERMRQRRRAAATVSFDDVLVDLRDALGSPGSAATLQNRFRVALIDEFQDTDPVQWDIFRTMFPDPADPDTSLVLVGDPKQSIYAFRGANVHTYLGAMRSTGRRPPTLATNWRSDGALLEATATLLRGTTFGDEAIAFSDVLAAPAHRDRRLHDADGEPWPAISLRLAIDAGLPRTTRDQLEAPEARAVIESDLVAQVRHLLEQARLPVERSSTGDAFEATATDATATDAADGPDRRVRPSDIAVLVRSNQDAERVRDALKLQGIPAVLARGGSVLDAPAADQWRWLLDAMLRPSDPVRARTFALSWFGGRSAEWVAGADDEDLVELQEQLSEWATVLGERGVTDFQRRLWVESGVVARVLARPDGDRELTDLEHIAELLGTGAGAEHQSVAGLLSVLDAPEPVEIDADVDRDQAARRVESEARAVQVMTVWVAKGLEFPIVCVPTMWSAPSSPTILPDDEVDGRRVFDLASKSWPDAAATKERKRLAAAESLGEGLRLLYVALTRARHHTVLWWTSPSGANRSALARVLFARDAEGRLDPVAFRAEKLVLPPDDETADRLAPLVAASGGTISVGVHGRVRPPADRWTPPSIAGAGAELTVARLDRHLDRSTRRWSFTAISAGDQHDHDGGSHDPAGHDPTDATGGDAGAADEGPVDPGPDDEMAGAAWSVGAAPTGLPGAPGASSSTAALATLPAGATFGTLVHSVLEHVDFSADSLADDLRAEVLRQLEFRPVDLAPRAPDGTRGDPEVGLDLLVQGLFDALDTPLGAMLGDRRLREWVPADRLDELDFDLRLGSGHGATTDAELGALIESHLAPADLFDQQPLHEWASTLVDGRFDAVLAGHLTGSIDAVLRMVGDDGEPRFVVVDYKTNRLTPRGALASDDDYAPDRLVQAMADHHYPLQALLYSVALHRYLRWRQPGYDPAVHLGGVAYLFLRGMVGPATPSSDGMRHGAFTWQVPTDLVVELSDLLAARSDLLTGADLLTGSDR